ncbi:MAG: sugar ABC transporter substrate-binding protein [Phormidesmis sp. RL_2_1]|nr:sugar ABC transporter substrate-binding protein [Phormidesmis sp. RL_2_1]
MVIKLTFRYVCFVSLSAVLAVGTIALRATASELAASDLLEPFEAFEPFASIDTAPLLLSDASSSPTAAVPTAASPTLDDAYALGPGDAITIEIFNVPEYSGAQQVLADGSLNLPVVGAVNVDGLTLQEAGNVISRAYQRELRYPQVTVVLASPRPLRVAIAGEVSQPGLYTLTPEGNAQFPTVAQALQRAGGVTQAADLHRVQLRRTNGRRPAQTIVLDLWELLNNGNVRQDLPLRDGDAIVIGETSTVNIAATNQLSASNLASNVNQPMTVAVVGEVFRPGAYEFGTGEEQNKGRTTVTRVVQTAGGIKPSADIRRIQVRRVTRSGAEQLIDLDFWQLLQAGDLSQDLVLQQGDTVIIPVATASTPSEITQLAAANVSPAQVSVNVVGEVASPGALQVAPNTTLNQAVLAAGGFNNRATEVVELIRLNPDGTVTQRQVEVDLAQGIDPDKNPLILNNDVVVVGRNGRAQFGDSIGSILSPFLQILSPLRLFF